MTDHSIVELFWQRKEEALSHTQRIYHGYLHTVAYRILANDQDSEEILNDTYLALWNSIPPQRPQNLRTYAAKITRRLAIKRFEKKKAQKRITSEYALSLEELRETVGDTIAAPEEDRAEELGRSINTFLHKLPKRERVIFVCRYFYIDPIPKIASDLNLSESNVYKILAKLRRELKEYLRGEGYNI